MKTRYIYPCLVNYDEADKIYYVQFIDIPEAFTDGDTLEEAIINAKDVLELCLYEYIKIAKEIPGPTQKAIKTNENEFVAYIDVWTPPIADKVKNQSVKKTLTIPQWLNEEAEKHNVNFSLLLQTAIKEYLGLK